MVDRFEDGFEFERRHNTTLLSIVNTLQWLGIALILAFVFREFIVEPFRIPTGSMAETLRGVHYHLRCTRCGYTLDLDGDSSRDPRPRCSSCGYWVDSKDVPPMLNGDRIFVLKSIYQFVEPKQWDVVVFKYPGDPEQNYIKRLIGSPGEKLEIYDGDFYIDGKISRKPPKVQNELWMCVYDNDYQPSGRWHEKAGKEGNVGQGLGNRKWEQPFVNVPGSNWNLSADGPTVFELDSEDGKVHTIHYDASKGVDFNAKYTYNSMAFAKSEVCSDLMFQCYVSPEKKQGGIGVTLKKYDTMYHGWVDFGADELRLERTVDGVTEVIAQAKLYTDVRVGQGDQLRFSNVDHVLKLRYGREELIFDLGADMYAVGEVKNNNDPAVEVFGQGSMMLAHIGIYRDMYYKLGVRPREDNSFTLGPDEFFLCGDNSPVSHDSRMWPDPGKGDLGQIYRAGIVPRDYLIGKAFYTYWGDSYKPGEGMLPVIPNFAQMKLIYGGK
ncbi:MAG: signal peptidase I [Anaerohalosphaera sp.]|nr:signal peptidase I [Anaerohalosphaera sp.]